MTFAEFIASQGDQTVADKLGVRVVKVQLWKHRGAIPRDFWEGLLDGFPTLEPADLVAMEIARPRKVRASA
jgi:hypothetical protein